MFHRAFHRDKLAAGGILVAILVGWTGLVVLSAVLTVPALRRAQELTNRTVCMSNLASIGKALTLYKGTNDNDWPWLAGVTSDWPKVPTGTNRTKDPNTTPGPPGDRAITSLPFLLVRENQPAKLFVCPSVRGDFMDPQVKSVQAARDDEEPDFYWDFSGANNISYSWQAPVKGPGGKYVQGLSDNDAGTVVIADRSPLYGPAAWDSTKWDPELAGARVRPHMSQNHDHGEQVNMLFVGMNAAKTSRPDFGFEKDMIYTASGDAKGGSRKATSVSMADHLSTKDTFLIGPVAGKGADAKGR